jgi:hypothetical protein
MSTALPDAGVQKKNLTPKYCSKMAVNEGAEQPGLSCFQYRASHQTLLP